MKHLNSQKGISAVIAIVILAVILIGGGAYYFKQQAKPTSKPVAIDATANWKTYTNAKYGFEIKYPENAKTSSLVNNQYLLLDVNYPLIFVYLTKGYQYGVSIGIINNPERLLLKEWYSQYYTKKKLEAEKNKYPFALNTEGESVQINNYPAYRVGIFAGDSTNVQYLISNGNYIYDIAYKEEVVGNVPDWAEKKTNIDKILSTFKFTNQNQTVDTSTWKTYTNTQYGFDIKYPSDWTHSSQVMSEVFSKVFMKGSQGFNCILNVLTVDTSLFDNYVKDSNPLNKKQTNIDINGVPAIKIAGDISKGFYDDYMIKNESGGKFSFEITQTSERFIDNKDGNGTTHVEYGMVSEQTCANNFNQMLYSFKFLK